MNLYLLGMLAAVIAYILYKDIKHEARVERFLNRLMAKDFQEFNYYDKKFDKDLDAEEKARKIQLTTIEEDLKVESEDKKDPKKNLDNFEEDWK